jgi:hypothetical protein
MADDLTTVATVTASAAAVLAVVVSAVVATITHRQWKAMTRGLELQSMIAFWEKFESRSMQDLRDLIRRASFDVSKAPRDTIAEIRQYLNLMELLSSFVKLGLISIETVEGVFHGSISEIWVHLEPYVQLRREKEGATSLPYAANYEWLVLLYRKRREERSRAIWLTWNPTLRSDRDSDAGPTA